VNRDELQRIVLDELTAIAPEIDAAMTGSTSSSRCTPGWASTFPTPMRRSSRRWTS
jgi:hypothetical protein